LRKSYKRASGAIRFHSAEYRRRIVELGILAGWDDGSSEVRERHAYDVLERQLKVRHYSINNALEAIDYEEKEWLAGLLAKYEIICNPWAGLVVDSEDVKPGCYGDFTLDHAIGCKVLCGHYKGCRSKTQKGRNSL